MGLFEKSFLYFNIVCPSSMESRMTPYFLIIIPYEIIIFQNGIKILPDQS